MNKSVREEIEKASLKRIEEKHFLGLDGRYKTAYLLGATWGSEFGYQLALSHCQVLREALFYYSKLGRRIAYDFDGYESDKAIEALEQFDKLVKED